MAKLEIFRLDFFPEMTLTHSPEKENFESLWVGTHGHGLDFFSKNDAYSLPAFWIFFQDLPIKVKCSFCSIRYYLEEGWMKLRPLKFGILT